MTVNDLPTGPRGQLLALALVAVLAAAGWTGVVAPLRSWYGERGERLAERITLEHRMEAVAASVPALRHAAGDAVSPDASRVAPQPATGAGALLEGATDAVAAARLQETMQLLAAQAGATLSSLETLPAEPVGPYRRIGLRVTLSAPWPVLVALLQAVARAGPPLLIDDLRLEGSHLAGPPTVKPIDALFTVIAFRQALPAAPT